VTDTLLVRPGAYHDSVTLLRVSQTIGGLPGVTTAQVAMATAMNVELTRGLGFDVPDTAGPNDLLIAIRADVDIDATIAAVDRERAPRVSAAPTTGVPSRSVRTAALEAPDAGIVLLSVPGPWVIGEALDAIAAGRHLMIFSDNVPVEHEVAIKEAAADAGLLVMGPDCGTAIVAGVGLGFANVLRVDGSGPSIGIVAASGTGAQQLSCLLDEAGLRVSHILGVGGRDLSDRVGGRSAVTAIALLDADPGTDRIVVISKPPGEATAQRISQLAAEVGTPTSTALLGPGRPDLTATAEELLTAAGVAVPDWPVWRPAPADPPGPGALRGLYAGGTLADEAMLVAGPELGDIRSNIPLGPDLGLPVSHGLPVLTGAGHAVVDLGDDEFTQGRPHPMIDSRFRLELLAGQARDPEVSVILLDVVLGYGADPDPAGALAPAITDALGAADRPPAVVVALIGTAGDPQDRDGQARTLAAAGATVFASNAAAARHAAAVATGREGL
jgi:FdrA protein